MPGDSNAEGLIWPEDFRETALRRAWFDRFCALPTGLRLKEVAQRLGEPYASVAFWATRFSYVYQRQPRGRKSLVNWDIVDWSLKNSELSRQLGVTGERIRQIRLARNLPPTQRHSDGGKRFREFVERHRRSLHRMSIREMIAESRAKISTATAHSILRKMDVPLRQHFIPWDKVNWQLPDSDLATAWQTVAGYVARVRAATGAGDPRWDGNPKLNEKDPAFRRLVAREVKNAQAARRRT